MKQVWPGGLFVNCNCRVQGKLTKRPPGRNVLLHIFDYGYVCCS